MNRDAIRHALEQSRDAAGRALDQLDQAAEGDLIAADYLRAQIARAVCDALKAAEAACIVAPAAKFFKTVARVVDEQRRRAPLDNSLDDYAAGS